MLTNYVYSLVGNNTALCSFAAATKTPAELLNTHPSLMHRRFNRLTLQQLKTLVTNTSCDAETAKVSAFNSAISTFAKENVLPLSNAAFLLINIFAGYTRVFKLRHLSPALAIFL